MPHRIGAVLLALACFFTLSGSSRALQDDTLLIRFLDQLTGQGRRVVELSSDHLDAPLWTISGIPQLNQYCPPEDTRRDYVWQMGVNSSDNGGARIDPAYGSLTMNWENYWCSSAGVPMQELNFRAQALNGVIVRPFHFEQHLATGYSSLGFQSHQIMLGPTAGPTLSIWGGRVNLVNGAQLLIEKPGTDALTVYTTHIGVGQVWSLLRVTTGGIVELSRQGLPIRTGAGLGMWNTTPPAIQPTLDLSSPTLACDVAQVLDAYGLVATVGECP